MKHGLKLCALMFLVLTVAQPALGTDYIIDPAHSSVSFKIKHLFSKVVGSFDSFSGTFSFDPAKPTTSRTHIVIDAASINTKIKKRDDHLRSENFFDAKKYPQLTFESTQYTIVNAPKKNGDPHISKMVGKLSIRGKTKDITLDVRYNGVAQDPWGDTAISFEAIGKLDRKEYGLTWNKALETGGVLVGNEVEIEILVEANPKPPIKKDSEKAAPATPPAKKGT